MGELVRKALMIGEHPGAARTVEQLLADVGIELVQTDGGGPGLKAFYSEHPDMVTLDLLVSDVDPFEVLGTVRELSDLPVLAVSGDDGEEERLRALRAGADCVTGPVSERELAARIEAILRRAQPGHLLGAVVDDEFIHIDHPRHRVEVLGVEVALTPIEFRMLACFAENPGRVLGHGQVLDMVWGDRIRDKDEVKLYVSYLRRKLGAAAGVDPLETVRGVGYRYRPRTTEAAERKARRDR
ncbi:MAG TPA: response regulator transcription factor [Solirubrobacterales bacterium]|nr:response regulator transcription factor [Solirubrobacterales bacterium]